MFFKTSNGDTGLADGLAEWIITSIELMPSLHNYTVISVELVIEKGTGTVPNCYVVRAFHKALLDRPNHWVEAGIG